MWVVEREGDRAGKATNQPHQMACVACYLCCVWSIESHFKCNLLTPRRTESLRRDFLPFCAQEHSRRLLKSTKHARLFSPGRSRAAAGKSLISSRSQLPGRGRNTLENVLPLYAKIAFFVFPWHLFLWLVLSFSSRSGLNEEKKKKQFFRCFFEIFTGTLHSNCSLNKQISQGFVIFSQWVK